MKESLGDHCYEQIQIYLWAHVILLNWELKLEPQELCPISKSYMAKKQPIYMYHIDAANLIDRIELHFYGYGDA